MTAVAGKNMDGRSKKEMSECFICESDQDDAKFKVKAASLLQYTLCGVPSVYYGDEIGMQGYVDPLNRKCYPWGNEDLELYNWHKKLGEIRRGYKVFVDGEYEEVFKSDGVFVYKRTSPDCEILIAVNVFEKDYVLEFFGELKDLLSGEKYTNLIELQGKSFFLLVNDNTEG
jgi:glycosidase